ncbi:hypothetical protein QA584_19335 [Anaerocolumna sp. AGMB13025]|uniref:hypothetical protein n=1 Tax=Anaerocolumna sp. AGMB13025 TaxID=3039116 RepID=UPI00241EDDF3|nr:hypothetical protein [Anaerocolumna sp. AGMB13025]WFR55752.1 hypothetical protein QA584_19335 [Anaerocolumna sp. AGMB13025]
MAGGRFHRKWKRIIVTAGIVSGFAIAVSAVLCGVLKNRAVRDDYVARYNGEEIDRGEFMLQLQLERTNTFDYFFQKYGAVYSDDFWNRDYNGEVPVRYAREKAMQNCVYMKAVKILAKEQGLIEDISYKTFVRSLTAENKRRKKATEKKQPVYGPIQYDESSYYTQINTNLIIKSKEKLLEGEYNPSDAELRAYYERVKDKYYKQEDFVQIKKLSISYGQSLGAFTEEDRKVAVEKMQALKNRLELGESFENIAESEADMVRISDITFDAETAGTYSKSEPLLYETVKLLDIGQTSGVIDEVQQKQAEIILLLDRESNGYKDYEEYKDSVVSNYIDEKYNELIEQNIKAGDLDINKAVYEKAYPD